MNWNKGQGTTGGARPGYGPGQGAVSHETGRAPRTWRMDRAIRTMRFRGAEEVAQSLATQSMDDQRALLLDTRPLHVELARRSGPAAPAGRAGEYRVAGQELEALQIFGDLGDELHFVPGAMVTREMEALTDMIAGLLDKPGDAGTRLGGLGQVLARFLLIHPYQGGNGRIARILVSGLARQLDLSLNSRWTIGSRGYGPGLFAAIQALPVSARPLDMYMRRFMTDPALRLQPQRSFPYGESLQAPNKPDRLTLRR